VLVLRTPRHIFGKTFEAVFGSLARFFNIDALNPRGTVNDVVKSDFNIRILFISDLQGKSTVCPLVARFCCHLKADADNLFSKPLTGQILSSSADRTTKQSFT
jgi:hypothetical protein